MRTLVHPRDYRSFGRRRPVVIAAPTSPATGSMDDVRLFLWTFAAGFLAMSIFLA